MNKKLTILLVGALASVPFIAILMINSHRNARMEAYAKTNNCKWYSTGSMYGDDRDFICVKKEAK